MVKTIAPIQVARIWLRNRVPPWLNVEVDRQFWQNFWSAIAGVSPSEVSSPDSHLLGRPHWRRITQVYRVLDSHLAEYGELSSYSKLIQHVEQVTGQGCSRKLIRKWKLDRGL
jgi:hypothetical protein